MAVPYPVLRWWLLPFVRSRIWTIRGLDNLPTSGGFILAPNHQAWVDSPIVAGAIYRRLQKELKFVAMSGKYLAFGGLPIDLTNKRQVIDIAYDFLAQGHPIVIFPEGNSNPDMELRTGKTGAARLALRSGLPVVPIGITGTRGVRPWQGLMWFFSIWRPCHVRIGTPVSYPRHELTGNDDALLATTTADIMSRISAVSGKPMPGQGPSLGRRGFLWVLAWRFFRPFFQWRIRIRGQEHLPEAGPFIVAANHSSYFDAPALAMAVFHVSGLQPMFPTKQTVAQTFQRFGGFGMLQALGMVPLDNAEKSKVLDAAIAHLQRHGVIGIFPEGTRNKPSINPQWKTEMLRGKTGAVRLMLATGAPIFPVSIHAPGGLGLGETILNALKVWKFFRITIGRPVQFENVPTAAPTKDDLDRLTKQLMSRIAEMSGMSYHH